MTRLHKGRPGPRITPIDWSALYFEQQSQPLYTWFRTAGLAGGGPVNSYLGFHAAVLGKAQTYGAGVCEYDADFGLFLGQNVRCILISRVLDGVGQYQFEQQGYWGSTLYTLQAWNVLPDFSFNKWSWGHYTPYYNYQLDPTFWSGLENMGYEYATWHEIPP